MEIYSDYGNIPPQRKGGIDIVRENIRYSIWDKQREAAKAAADKEHAEKTEYEYKHNNVHNAQYNGDIEASKADMKTTAYKLVDKGQEAKLFDKLGKPLGESVETEDGKQVQYFKKGQVVTYSNENGQPVQEFIFKDGSKAVYTVVETRRYIPSRIEASGDGWVSVGTVSYGDQYLTGIETTVYNPQGDIVMQRTGLHPDERCP